MTPQYHIETTYDPRTDMHYHRAVTPRGCGIWWEDEADAEYELRRAREEEPQ